MRFTRKQWSELAGQAELTRLMRTALQGAGYVILAEVLPADKVAALYAELNAPAQV